MLISALIIYYRVDTGLAALIMCTWRNWLSLHSFQFRSSLETLSGQLLDKLTRVWLITCGSCFDMMQVSVMQGHCAQLSLDVTVSPTTSGACCGLKLSGPFPAIQLAQEARGESV